MVDKGENTADGSTKPKPEIVAFTNAICSNKDGLESVILSDISQIEEIAYDIPYMWNLKRSDTNELTHKTERDSQT